MPVPQIQQRHIAATWWSRIMADAGTIRPSNCIKWWGRAMLGHAAAGGLRGQMSPITIFPRQTRSGISSRPIPRNKRYTLLMGLTFLRVEVGNPSNPLVLEGVDFLIDSGAIYSVVPAQTLQKLGIQPLAEEEFRLAD